MVVAVARDRRRALGHAAALLAAAIASIAPITLRNYAVFGEWVPVSINGGLTLWQGVADAGGEAEGAFRRDKLVMARRPSATATRATASGGRSRTGSSATASATAAPGRSSGPILSYMRAWWPGAPWRC